MILGISCQLDRVLFVSRQWIQISMIWALVAISGTAALLLLEGETRITAFGAIAASSLAIVSLEHLLSSKSKDTVREQVYVSAGTLFLLGIFTLIALAS